MHNDTYNLTRYETDKELTKKIKTGKGDEKRYEGFNHIFVDNIFEATVPEEVEQSYITGKNDLSYAKAAIVNCIVDKDRNPYLNNTAYRIYDNMLEEMTANFTETTTHVRFVLFTVGGIEKVFFADILGDFQLMLVAIVLVGIYSCLFLGSCSAIHIRVTVALMGLACVVFSYTIGSSICFLLGH